MMLVIGIDLDNAAFTENGGAEVKRILTDIADKFGEADGVDDMSGHVIKDVNGNSVGMVIVGESKDAT